MKFDPKKIQFIVDSVYYDGIDVGLTRQMILDWTVQTGEDSYAIIHYYYKKKIFIHYYYKKKISEIRDKKLEELIHKKES
ncbi:MAG: hypothetical protein EB079_05570 [Verrucomicrobia bacterium]|nr:hypothetical protein [Verrucomicrobiota bacterium]